MPQPTEQLFNNDKDMTNQEIAITDDEWKAFEQAETAKFTVNSFPTPPAMKFHGDRGIYSIGCRNKETKEFEFTDIGKEWQGVVLAVRWFVRWKHDPNSTLDVRTKEFQNFTDERITLLKIDKQNRGGEAPSKDYQDYQAFKQSFVKEDEITGKKSSPYDLHFSLYILRGDTVVRYRGKGLTRSGWFDYSKEVLAPTTVLTQFGCSEKIELDQVDPETGEKKFYYTGTFASVDPAPAEMRAAVMRSSKELHAWFASYEQSQEAIEPMTPIAAPEVAQIAEPDDELPPIDCPTSEIPF